MNTHLELKKRELEQLKQELKTLKEGSLRYLHVSERLEYVMADIFEFERSNNKKSLLR